MRKSMRHLVWSAAVVAVAALGACAQQSDRPARQDKNQAIEDFISVRALEELDLIRTDHRDGWHDLSLKYIVYETRRNKHLIEFSRSCHELVDNTRITPDIRHETGVIRARFDTLRGCRIAKIYALTEAEAAELEQIGESPGSRN